MTTSHKNLVWAEIDFKAVRSNLRALKRFVRKNNVEIMPVIKADAYGHGMERIGKCLQKEGIKFFAVADLKEAIGLRKARVRGEILLFKSNVPSQAKEIVKYKLTPTVFSLEMARALNNAAARRKKKIAVHVKVDTGMGRLGVWHEEAVDFITKVSRLSHLRIAGIYTHFPVADTNRAFTQRQIKIFEKLIKELELKGIKIPYIHIGNSMGVLGYMSKLFTLIRPGLMLYGLHPAAQTARKITLKPVMAVKARIILVKSIERGRSISYGRTFIAKAKIKVATIPIGYSNGYSRSLSNRAACLIHGKRCRVLGRVTMDQIVVDVTHVSNVKVGDTAVLLGRQKGKKITAEELAEYQNTVNYEIVCSLGSSLPRVFLT